MIVAQPYRVSVLGGALALAGLVAGCAMDSEAELRAEIGDWVDPGATLYFKSHMSCTAARFETRSPRPLPKVAMATSLDAGLRHIAAERTVGFALEGASPTQISEAVMSADLPGGIGLLSAGVGGKDCMDDAEKARYFAALNDPAVMMIYAPQSDMLLLLDVAAKEVIVMRGDV